MGCPDVIRIVAGCESLTLSKAGQLVQQCVEEGCVHVSGGRTCLCLWAGQGNRDTKEDGTHVRGLGQLRHHDGVESLGL